MKTAEPPSCPSSTNTHCGSVHTAAEEQLETGGGGFPTQPTKAVWYIITGGSQKVQILPTLD